MDARRLLVRNGATYELDVLDQLISATDGYAMVLRSLNHPTAAKFIGLAAVIALPTVIMAFMYGQSRIFFVMARDGLLPERLSKVNEKTGTPALMTLVTGVISAVSGIAWPWTFTDA